MHIKDRLALKYKNLPDSKLEIILENNFLAAKRSEQLETAAIGGMLIITPILSKVTALSLRYLGENEFANLFEANFENIAYTAEAIPILAYGIYSLVGKRKKQHDKYYTAKKVLSERARLKKSSREMQYSNA